MEDSLEKRVRKLEEEVLELKKVIEVSKREREGIREVVFASKAIPIIGLLAFGIIVVNAGMSYW